jgi:3alpha(or 20beta)-hydroxysteroid dehydrogenase
MTMTGRLHGKVALITGSARGMGAAEAQLFADEGAQVVVSDVLDAEGQVLVKEIGDQALFVRLDVTREADWQAAVAAAVDAFGKLDILVNNAGIVRAAPLTLMDVEEFRLVTEINQVGVFLGMKSVAGAMTAAGGGSIINISSIDGIQGSPYLCAYAATKFAVRGMTKVAALELAGQNIRVNSIHPGGVSTPMCGEIPGLSREQVEALVGQSVPMRRIGQPQEVARMALFLASDDSSYCTGAEFVVDGGATCGTIADVLEQAG